MSVTKKLALIGYASCSGAMDKRCALAPDVIRKLDAVNLLAKNGTPVVWKKTLRAQNIVELTRDDNVKVVHQICSDLAKEVHDAVSNDQHFVVFGGDHSSAIGTWSGVKQALTDNQTIGLIWIDAHMDSHTPDTSPSGAIHGMPLACLLGYGDMSLREIGVSGAKLKPENVCLIGIRSYETGEAALLKRLGVKIYYMHDVFTRGLEPIFNEAKQLVSKNTQCFGISIDLDVIDPHDAPGVGSPESHGLSAVELLNCVNNLSREPGFIGAEIAELNPVNDMHSKTANLAIDLAAAIYK